MKHCRVFHGTELQVSLGAAQEICIPVAGNIYFEDVQEQGAKLMPSSSCMTSSSCLA